PLILSRIALQPSEPKWWTIFPGATPVGELSPDKPAEVTFRTALKSDAGHTRPYFSRRNIEQLYYDILDERYLNLPLAPYPLTAYAQLMYNGIPLEIRDVVQTTKRITGLGPVHEPLAIAPAISIAIAPRAGIVPLSLKSVPV